jgi:hypothetical protein
LRKSLIKEKMGFQNGRNSINKGSLWSEAKKSNQKTTYRYF